MDAKPYSFKAILLTSFQAVTHGDGDIVSSPKKNRSLLHIMGSGISGEIKVCLL